MWTTTAQAISDLRTLIADGPTDKLCDQKLVFGPINGVNTRFKTFELRRVTDFTAPIVSPSPVGVFKNFVILNPSTDLSTDDLTSGTFNLAVAPVDGDEIRASYYYQWFLDTDLDTFLQTASQWLGNAPTYVNTPDGLIPAVLHYAAEEAYARLSLWFSTNQSNAFMLNDAPDPKNKGVADSYQKMADSMESKAEKLRAGYYTRQDQPLAPLFASNFGRVRNLTPRR